MDNKLRPRGTSVAQPRRCFRKEALRVLLQTRRCFRKEALRDLRVPLLPAVPLRVRVAFRFMSATVVLLSDTLTCSSRKFKCPGLRPRGRQRNSVRRFLRSRMTRMTKFLLFFKGVSLNHMLRSGKVVAVMRRSTILRVRRGNTTRGLRMSLLLHHRLRLRRRPRQRRLPLRRLRRLQLLLREPRRLCPSIHGHL